MAGRDPILPACLRAKFPSGFRGHARPLSTRRVVLVECFAAYENSQSCSQLFRACLASTGVDWKGTSMPLLKPPEPQTAMRKFFIRIEEPLALNMERYAEFLGTDRAPPGPCLP